MSYYDSREWKLLRDSVVNRDRYTCQECGYKKGNKEKRRLSAHHIIPRKQGGADHPENLVNRQIAIDWLQMLNEIGANDEYRQEVAERVQEL